MHTPTLVLFFFFFFNDTATTEIYTLSLHDALPIYARGVAVSPRLLGQPHRVELLVQVVARRDGPPLDLRVVRDDPVPLQRRSEEHTSELQSLAYLVCRLLLEKKKKRISNSLTVNRN